jgi:hypothetical protein
MLNDNDSLAAATWKLPTLRRCFAPACPFAFGEPRTPPFFPFVPTSDRISSGDRIGRLDGRFAPPQPACEFQGLAKAPRQRTLPRACPDQGGRDESPNRPATALAQLNAPSRFPQYSLDCGRQLLSIRDRSGRTVLVSMRHSRVLSGKGSIVPSAGNRKNDRKPKSHRDFFR